MGLHRRPGHRPRHPTPVLRTLAAAVFFALFLVLATKSLRGLNHEGQKQDQGQMQGGGRQMAGAGQSQGARQQAGPAIPRHFHQVYVSSSWQLPDGVKINNPAQLGEHDFPSSTEDMQTWYDLNAPVGFTYHFWDKPAMEALVQKHYAEYWEAWQALPKHVERADFARYIVLHHMGGAYADGDVACLRPISDLFHPSDALVASWEDAFPNQQTAIQWHYGRQAQMVNWFLAAAPGHPALRYVMDAIKQNAGARLFADASRDTVERTGPGIWTEAVLHAAFKHPPAQGKWNVRVLPKITAGWDFPAAPKAYVVPAVFLQHNFRGSWYNNDPTDQEFKTVHPADYMTPIKHPLLPTSVPMDPPFTLLHHMPGAGDLYEGLDLAFSFIQFGQWQPGPAVSYPLHIVERLLGGLATAARKMASSAPASRAGTDGDAHTSTALLDVGAGYGMFSLAAASRGHPVLAFEAAPKSAEALAASFQHNGFSHGKLVQLALGDDAGSVCLDGAGRNSMPLTQEEAHQHGYSLTSSREQPNCKRTVQRQVANEAVTTALPADVHVGAVRLSTYGWTKRVLQGLAQVLDKHKPFMVMLEWRGGAVDGEFEEALGLGPTLQWLAERGWARVTHTGPVCRKQWKLADEGLRHRWPKDQNALVLDTAMVGECELPMGRLDNFLFMQETQTEVLFVTRPLYE